MRPILALLACCTLLVSTSASSQEKDLRMNNEKLEAFVDANIKATHAFESLAAKKLGESVRGKYWNIGGASDKELNDLVDLQKQMLAEPEKDIIAWARDERSNFNEKKYIGGILGSKLSTDHPKLPVNVWAAWFKEKAPDATAIQVKSLASLQQVLAEIDRDGDLLQDLFRVYSALGLPVYFGQIGIKASTDEEFMSFAEELPDRMILGPYEKETVLVQMAFRKMYNWGRRYNGERDRVVMAKELLADPELKDAVEKAGKLNPKKIAVIGHSFSMEVNWATPCSFVPIVTEMMKTANPKMQFKYFQQGGMDAVTAYKRFSDDVAEWHPDLVLFVIMNEGPDNRNAMKKMVDEFTQGGAKCVIFDCLWPAMWDQQPKKKDPVLTTIKLDIIEVKKLLVASPDKQKFLCLDKVHMTEPWHMLMAREWFKYLAGTRKEDL